MGVLFTSTPVRANFSLGTADIVLTADQIGVRLQQFAVTFRIQVRAIKLPVRAAAMKATVEAKNVGLRTRLGN